MTNQNVEFFEVLNISKGRTLKTLTAFYKRSNVIRDDFAEIKMSIRKIAGSNTTLTIYSLAGEDYTSRADVNRIASINNKIIYRALKIYKLKNKRQIEFLNRHNACIIKTIKSDKKDKTTIKTLEPKVEYIPTPLKAIPKKQTKSLKNKSLVSSIVKNEYGEPQEVILNLASSLSDWLLHRASFPSPDDTHIVGHGIKLYELMHKQIDGGLQGIDYTRVKVEGGGAYNDAFLRLLKQKDMLVYRKNIDEQYLATQYDLNNLAGMILPLFVLKNALGLTNSPTYQINGWQGVIDDYVAKINLNAKISKQVGHSLIINSAVHLTTFLMDKLEAVGVRKK